nr:hypothetical protein [Novosphingobium panipatense]
MEFDGDTVGAKCAVHANARSLVCPPTQQLRIVTAGRKKGGPQRYPAVVFPPDDDPDRIMPDRKLDIESIEFQLAERFHFSAAHFFAQQHGARRQAGNVISSMSCHRISKLSSYRRLPEDLKLEFARIIESSTGFRRPLGAVVLFHTGPSFLFELFGMPDIASRDDEHEDA